jgi:hypothetical protein
MKKGPAMKSAQVYNTTSTCVKLSGQHKSVEAHSHADVLLDDEAQGRVDRNELVVVNVEEDDIPEPGGPAPEHKKSKAASNKIGKV